MQKPLLSIITVNYNNNAGLERTIRSVIAQRSDFVEYLVIDGGSTDGSADLIKNNSSFIHYWISEKDHGVYDAMNKGIEKAAGDYLLFLNSGDSFATDDVLKKVEFQLRKGEYDIIYGNIVLNKTVVKYNRPLTLYNMMYLGVSHQAMFLKASLFQKAGVYDTQYKVTADSCHLILCLARYNASAVYVDAVIADIEPGGMSMLNKEQNRQEKRSFMQKEFSALADDYARLHEYNIRNLPGRMKNFIKRRFLR